MPFQPPAKLFFEHVKMGQAAVKVLKIRNPSDNPIHVSYHFLSIMIPILKTFYTVGSLFVKRCEWYSSVQHCTFLSILFDYAF